MLIVKKKVFEINVFKCLEKNVLSFYKPVIREQMNWSLDLLLQVCPHAPIWSLGLQVLNRAV